MLQSLNKQPRIFVNVASVSVTELIETQVNVNFAVGVAFLCAELSTLMLRQFKGISELSDNESDKYDCM